MTFQSRGAQMVETKNHQTLGRLLHPEKSLKVVLLPLWFKDDL